MSLINLLVGTPLGWVMWLCYRLVGSYGIAILLFTLLSKVILMPLSIIVQKNSIKMIGLQLEINQITLKHFGDRDTIADRTMELYKREKYSPALGMVPLIIQIVLVLGLINVMYNPMQHLLRISAETCDALIAATTALQGVENLGSGAQLKVMEALTNPQNLDYFMGLGLPGVDMAGVIAAAGTLDTAFLGINLASVPPLFPIALISVVPLLSCLSTFLLCWAQNRENVLQKEQGFLGRWGVALFTVVFSTYFTFLVPAGVGVYWIASNLFALGTLYLLNWLYPPEKDIDYVALRETQRKLRERKEAQKESFKKLKPYKKQEKADYRRFLKGKEHKQFVIYSESNGFYKYYAGMIDYILEHSDIVIHYITSDPHDNIFQMKNPRIQAYYIGDIRLIPLFMKMDADMVLMTVPELDVYHLKRSMVRKDIEYVYMEHGLGSNNMLGRPEAIAHYDTIFDTGPHQTAEDRAIEAHYGFKPRRLVQVGYGLIDEMTEAWEKAPKKSPDAKKTVMIAPSWQTDNIMDSCVDKLVEEILPLGVKLIIRPHPQYIRLYPDRVQALLERYEDMVGPDFEIQTDFSSTDSVYYSDLLITDWSNISMEFAMSTFKPVMYINTPMKVLNPNYKEIDIVPIDIWIRSELGAQLELDEVNQAGATVAALLSDPEKWAAKIRGAKEKAMYNIGHGSEAAARYVISRLEPKSKK